ncbi:MAG: helix-turn-helix transcriptional regulator [Lentilactobacillus diolivorans]
MAELVGKRIKQKRLEKGLTQAEVADKLYVTRQTVAYWESDQHLPSLSVLSELATFYDVSISYFLGESIQTTHKFNFFALVGSFLLNLILIPTVFLVSLATLVFAWLMDLICIPVPIIIVIESQIGVHQFAWWRIGVGWGIFVVAAIGFPILWLLTKQFIKFLEQYVKYTIESITYQKVIRIN